MKKPFHNKKSITALFISLIVAAIAAASALTGCSTSDSNRADSAIEQTVKSSQYDSSEEVSEGSLRKSALETTSAGEDKTTETATADSSVSNETSVSAATAGNIEEAPVLSDIPEYSGSPYTEVNDNWPFFATDGLSDESCKHFSSLDNLGRCGVCYAIIGQDLMPTEERGAIGMVKPSGWHTVKYNGVVDGNYLYNRCHLIGYQLCGENANTKNLITGTRYLNIQGMLPFENMVADYVESTANHVAYRVTPVFEGNNLVASGVLMEAYSIEDSGDGIRFNVFCHNIQPGIEITYSTGESKLSEQYELLESAEDTYNETTTAASSSSSTEETYILNTNTKKFHHSWCSSVNDMKAKNKKEYTGSRDDIINQGYVPCKRCNP